tara:strand:+ start:87 stop:461 length:375 start_codon:yes stop_codon:yes gene_type:complete
MPLKFLLIFFYFLLIFFSKSYAKSVHQLKCQNIKNNSVHTFKIYKNYKVVNILPNGYRFDYIINKESKSKVTAYFYQKKENFIKKFYLEFNLDTKVLYDEMYIGKDINNLFLKDKKIFSCKDDK